MLPASAKKHHNCGFFASKDRAAALQAWMPGPEKWAGKWARKWAGKWAGKQAGKQAEKWAGKRGLPAKKQIKQSQALSLFPVCDSAVDKFAGGDRKGGAKDASKRRALCVHRAFIVLVDKPSFKNFFFHLSV